MDWNVINVWPKGTREIGVRFEDGTEGTVRIDPSFCVGVFEALFDNAAVHAARVENGAVTWPGGLDLAPDAMYDRIKADAQRYYEISRLRARRRERKSARYRLRRPQGIPSPALP